jgi:hypothetical protein
MKTTLKRTITIFGILSMAFFFSAAKKVSPVNSDCPYSGKAVKAGNKKCPFSSKPAKKPVVVAFCCGNCVDKASS